MAVPDTRDNLEAVGYRYMHSGVCRGCGVELHWFSTPRGKRMAMAPISGTEDEDPQRLECHFGKCKNEKNPR